jgi:AAA domain
MAATQPRLQDEELLETLGVAFGSRPKVIDGATWILDCPPTAEAVWGGDRAIAWSAGEYLLLTGPEGTGKTRISRQIIFALLGDFDTVLDLPVRPASGKVLLIAADRPVQQRRLFALAAGESERQVLAERLLVHVGPLDFDISKDTAALASWATSLGASHLVIDSLGALVGGLTKDEVGSNVAISLARTVAAGVEVMALYHPRKATSENKEPRELSDVYGSRWLTALAGSVLSLWGRPGDPIVSLRHLKPVVDEVGPFGVTFDALSGYASVAAGSDLLALLRSAKDGLTARATATQLYGTAKPDRAQVERARRSLEKLVPRFGYRRDGGSPGEPATYFALAPSGRQEPLE